ncbi:MAG: VCBS repeat-containing protein [Propionivibrio sp.]|uniref:VCBS repeat-containing protein n=1 Tax=Propionivibrio sp. TaxID=2212460 RepID=UPI0025DAF30C|nr:VCBS repeat-containing protein [Propionivibrio sp.]MBL0208308.1 VCBS repeat-containing protein [Propionivibrio sp.]
MKIDSASVQLDSSHSSQQRHELKTSLRAWVGDRRPDFEGNSRRQVSGASPLQVQISETGRAAHSSEAAAIQNNIDVTENDPVLSLIRAMVALLIGHAVNVFDASELQVSAPATVSADPNQAMQAQAQQPAGRTAGFGIEYDRHESYTDTEQTLFQATGVIRASDGKEVSFSISLTMARNYHEESNVSIREGDARKKMDPLVLNFSGSAAQLTSRRFKFDLDSDGRPEEMNFVTENSGFLAFDRNGDGKINNGSELFGAKSGNGFAELSALDTDHNGWIDENDKAFSQLSIWRKDASGKDILASLKQANIGALSLTSVESPFELKSSDNTLQGQVRSSGMFLQEDGKTGTMQQIDLTV